MMAKLNYKSLPERTADGISDMIYRENYRTGAKLPGELELAQMLEVSRNTVRQAVHILAEKGVLEVRRGSGTFVSSQVNLSDDPLGLSLICDKKKLTRDLLDIRLLIEPRMAALAAECRTEAELAELERICTKMEEEQRAGHNYYQWDMEFHTLIAKCSRNLVVHNLLPSIHQAILLQENVISRRLGEKSVEAHWRICRAVKGRRCSEAYDAMLAHLMQNQERMLDQEE